MVINSLTDGKSTHVPYRDSKLTRVLQESLGGNSKTSLIVTCSPSVFNDQETVSTLRFGTRVKNIKNKAKINKDVTLGELKLQIERIEAELQATKKKNGQLEKFIKNKGLVFTLDDSEPTVVIVKEDDIPEEKKVEDLSEEYKSIVIRLETATAQISRLSNECELKVLFK